MHARNVVVGSHDGELRLDVSLDHYPASGDAEEFAKLPWKHRLAWRLRHLADRIDKGVTYTHHGKLPGWVTGAELWDALAFGHTEFIRYLTDMDREMREVPAPQSGPRGRP